ncbi:hypothetical protein B0H14DRAFT_2562429 [Mycena olivaceomarginata]|nr:hypothetical protein B0H14DRAFT_2562429 [Mycena olivaceomarginata]
MPSKSDVEKSQAVRSRPKVDNERCLQDHSAPGATLHPSWFELRVKILKLQIFCEHTRGYFAASASSSLEMKLQQNLALILRQDDHLGLIPTAAVVAVKGIVQNTPDGANGKVFWGHPTGDNQMWCIT